MRENVLKRKNIRGVLSVILTLVMILTLIPVTSQDVYADDAEISGEILEITDVIIPKVTGEGASFEDYLEKRLLEELPEGTNLVSYDLSCDDNDSDYSYINKSSVVVASILGKNIIDKNPELKQNNDSISNNSQNENANKEK